MALNIIIAIVIILAIFFILYKITKKVWKTLLFGFIIIIVLILIFGFIVYKDFKDINDNIGKRDNLFVLKEDSEFLTAFVLNFDKLDEKDYHNNVIIIDKAKLSQYNENFNNEDNKKTINDGYYKAFFFDINIIENSDLNEFRISEQLSLIKNEVLQILKSDEAALSLFNQRLNIGTERIKPTVFSLAFINILSNKPEDVIKGLKNDDIEVYKETIVFELIEGELGSIATGFIPDLNA